MKVQCQSALSANMLLTCVPTMQGPQVFILHQSTQLEHLLVAAEGTRRLPRAQRTIQRQGTTAAPSSSDASAVFMRANAESARARLAAPERQSAQAALGYDSELRRACCTSGWCSSCANRITLCKQYDCNPLGARTDEQCLDLRPASAFWMHPLEF